MTTAYDLEIKPGENIFAALGFPPDPALTLDEGDEGEEAGVANANGGQR